MSERIVLNEAFFRSIGATATNHSHWGPSYLFPENVELDCSPFYGCLITSVEIDGIQRTLVRPELCTWISDYIRTPPND